MKLGTAATLQHSPIDAVVFPVDPDTPQILPAMANVSSTALSALKESKSPVVLYGESCTVVLSPCNDSTDLRTSIHRGLEAVRKTSSHVGVVFPKDCDSAQFDQVIRTSVLSSHRFDRHLSESRSFESITALYLDGKDDVAEKKCEAVSERFLQQLAVAEGTVFARELVNERAAVVTPSYIENIAAKLAQTFPENVRMRVLHYDELLAHGFNLITAVGQAAEDQPRIVVLEVGQDKSAQTPVAMVGKGVTFDTGGLNLKPTGSIETMHMDMGGAAAVLGAVRALAMNKTTHNVVAVLALAENAIGPRAVKPHAILQSKKGSVEVSNTDAEGRLCLADAMSFVQSEYSPSHVVDIATLTGACVVALGEYTAGLFSNDDKMSSEIVTAGENAFERCWRLPILREHS